MLRCAVLVDIFCAMADTQTKRVTIGIRPSAYRRLLAIANARGTSLCDAFEACAIGFAALPLDKQNDAVMEQLKQRPKRKRRAVLSS